DRGDRDIHGGVLAVRGQTVGGELQSTLQVLDRRDRAVVVLELREEVDDVVVGSARVDDLGRAARDLREGYWVRFGRHRLSYSPVVGSESSGWPTAGCHRADR